MWWLAHFNQDWFAFAQCQQSYIQTYWLILKLHIWNDCGRLRFHNIVGSLIALAFWRFRVFAFWLNQSSSCLLQLFHSLNRICLLYCLCCYCNCSTTTSSVALSDQHRHRSWPLLFCVRIKPNPSHIVRHISRYLKCLLHWIFDFWRSVERSVNAIMPICCSISATGAAHKIAASHRGLRVLQLFALVGSTGALNIVVNNWF